MHRLALLADSRIDGALPAWLWHKIQLLGGAMGRLDNERRKAKAQQLHDKQIQALLSLRSLLKPTARELERAAAVEGAYPRKWIRGAKTQIQELDDEIQDLLEVCRYTLPLDTLLEIPKGHFWADLIIMGAKYENEHDRIEATDRLLSIYFKKPIYPLRWYAVVQEVAREATTHGVSLRDEFRQRARSALHAVARGAVEGLKLRQQEKAIQSVRTALNEALTKDILGSDWRRKRDGGNGKQPQKLGEAELLRKVELRLILGNKNLTERDVQLVLLKRQGFSGAEVAARLGITAEAARTAWYRTKEKIKKLAS